MDVYTRAFGQGIPVIKEIGFALIDNAVECVILGVDASQNKTSSIEESEKNKLAEVVKTDV